LKSVSRRRSEQPIHHRAHLLVLPAQQFGAIEVDETSVGDDPEVGRVVNCPVDVGAAHRTKPNERIIRLRSIESAHHPLMELEMCPFQPLKYEKE
jgi:hypothetical protein